MPRLNSRVKGGVGERDLKAALKKHGLSDDAERTAQRCGRGGVADLTGIEGILIECKRVEKLNIWNAMKRAVEDAAGKLIAAVFHRRNRTSWLVTVRLEDLEEFCRRVVANCDRVKARKEAA